MPKFLLACKEIAEIIDTAENLSSPEKNTNGNKSVIRGNPDLVISAVNRLDNATEGELAFFSDVKFIDMLNKTKASCVIVPKNVDESLLPDGITYIKTQNPYKSFVLFLFHIDSLSEKKSAFIHPTAVIEQPNNIPASVYIGAMCYVGRNCRIGENVVLHPGVVLYDEVEIGDNTVLHAKVVCYQEVIIGRDCIIHSGAIIGADGFGYVENNDHSYTKIPQVGIVTIGDRVEIGANTAIDRSVAGSTIVADGVKIDNLVQVGHNVEIGENTGIVSQVGIAGSCKIGKRNRLGGQVGFSGHIDMADDVTILAQSGVHKNIEKPGIYFGAPIESRMRGFKIITAMGKLPELLLEFEQMKRTIAKLEGESINM